MAKSTTDNPGSSQIIWFSTNPIQNIGPATSTTAATTLWMKHQLLMGSRDDAACLVEALAKIRTHADELRGR